MHNWPTMPQQATYEHNWFGNIFPIKDEPQSPTYSPDLNRNLKITHTNDVKTSKLNQNIDDLEIRSQYKNLFKNDITPGSYNPFKFNPLTPPGYPNAVMPLVNFQENITETAQITNQLQKQQQKQDQENIQENDVSLTPGHTPPMDTTPPKSPKLEADTSSIFIDSPDGNRLAESDNDEDIIHKPRYNSHGKVKQHKCRHCDYIAITKVSFWEHAKLHIRPDKILKCDQCPFVTELKHHLEYHIRKHKNLKPFVCDKCSYSCVNKSMLNSHLKSHSSVQCYRCADCMYTTKYCHSLKLHLRRSLHRPGIVLNEDGTPNPNAIIDTYGTRRGPKIKSLCKRDNSNNNSTKRINNDILLTSSPPSISRTTPPITTTSNTLHAIQQPAQQNNRLTHSISPLLNRYQSNSLMSNLIPNPLASMFQQGGNMVWEYFNLLAAQRQAATLAKMSPNCHENDIQSINSNISEDKDDIIENDDDDEEDYDDESSNCEYKLNNGGAIDLTRTTSTPEKFDTIENSSATQKGKYESETILKIQDVSENINEQAVDDQENITEDTKNVETTETENTSNEQSHNQNEHNNNNFNNNNINNFNKFKLNEDNNGFNNSPSFFECKYCDMLFRDAVLYTIHMGYHSCDDVFKCNMCGAKYRDRVSFHVHIARDPHS